MSIKYKNKVLKMNYDLPKKISFYERMVLGTGQYN